MIMPTMSLHVSGLGHVAVDTFTAGLPHLIGMILSQIAVHQLAGGIKTNNLVMTVGNRIDNWRIGIAAIMTAHAEPIARQKGFAGMRIMAIRATNSPHMHATAEKRGILVIFIADLAIGVKGLRNVHNGRPHLIQKQVPWLEVADEFGPAGMAKPAIVDDALR